MHPLQPLLKNLYTVFGINMSIFDIDENPITTYPEKNSPFCHLIKSVEQSRQHCLQCDHNAFQRVKESKKIEVYQCDFLLYEACVPLYTYGIHSGYLMMGQAISSANFYKKDIKRIASPFIKNEKVLDEAINKIPIRSQEQIEAFAEIVDICAKYITMTNRIESKKKNIAMEIKKYVSENFRDDISMDDLAELFQYSKSTLNRYFQIQYGTTIHQYIIACRISASYELLEDPQISIQETAYQCGFKDANYFIKVFKNIQGYTPKEYRLRQSKRTQ